MSVNISGIDAKKAREAAKISQSAIAASLGVNRTYYSLFEAGRLTLDDEKLIALSQLIRPSTSHAKVEANSSPSNDSNLQRHHPKTSHISARGHAASQLISKVDKAHRRLQSIQQYVTKERMEPHLLNSKVERALNALERLNQTELIELAKMERLPSEIISRMDIPAPLEQRKITVQLQFSLICNVIYGEAWSNSERHQLHHIVREIRSARPDAGMLVPFPSFLEQFLESEDDARKTTARLRLESAPYLVDCAIKGIKIGVQYHGTSTR